MRVVRHVWVFRCWIAHSHTALTSYRNTVGYGFILSRGAVQNLIRPVDCSSSKKDEFEQNVCNRLQDDLSGEARYFRNGMSVSDLMGAQVRNNLFTNYTNDGNWAYCKYWEWLLYS